MKFTDEDVRDVFVTSLANDDSSSDDESSSDSSDSSSSSEDEQDDDHENDADHDRSHNTSRSTKSSNDSHNNEDDDSDDKEDNNAGSDCGSDSESGTGEDNNEDASDSDKSEEEDIGSGAVSEEQRNSSDDSDASSGNQRRHNKNKKDEPAWQHDPAMYGVRRSGRDRRQPDRMEIQSPPAQHKKLDRRKDSSSDSDSDASPVQHLINKPTKSSAAKQERFSKRSGCGKISYKESETESDEEEEEDEEEESGSEAGSGRLGKDQDDSMQTIEKIIDTRIGKKGAVGMQTYIYEVEKTGDPNSNFDPNDSMQTERHFLIKWKDWAHIHNTWESEESLKTQRVKGLKKLDNFFRKEEELMLWRNSATPEEIEYMEIQSELEKELYASHLRADRIFAEAAENDKTFYYVKWQGLPYSEATWELESLTAERYPDKIEAYKQRENSTCTPRQCPALKHRPKFIPIKEQPSYLGEKEGSELRDYQLQGMNWLVHAWCKHNSVILADEMGLGKTIQAISFISYLFHTHQMYGPYLLVLPLSTINAWEREFSIWAPDINVIVYIGDRESRKVIRDYEWAFSSKRLKFNVVLTTYEILLRDKEELKEATWSILVIDEAHRLKNEESQLYQALQEFRSNHRLLITGTPLQNSLKELFALLHFIMPEKFMDWEYFESQHDKHREKGFHKLHTQLEPFLLRRVKKDVEKSLPSKVEQILRVVMTKAQRQFYRWILTKNYEMLRKGARGSTASFVNIVMELKKCCNHSTLTKPLDEIPLNATEMLQQLLRGSGKLVLLDKLLMRLHEKGHRVLIFSQMVRMLDILSQYLQLRRLPFQRLDGSIRGELRRQALDHFNAEGSSDFCFLLSTRAGGLGINLATADTVIIFDSDWNPQNDLQAQARAHRIGQKNQVNIYRLVTKDSIEEDIIERAKKKMVLDHLVIQSMDTSGRTVFNKKMSNNSTPFNKEELNAILKFGAEDLFKDSDDENEEPACDIDEILNRAETREDGPSSVGDDLLSAFKVASINLDEDEEVSKIEPTQDENTKDWDEIIPESYLKEVRDEAKAKEMADLYLPPRSRKTVNNQGEVKEAGGKEEEGGSSSSGSDNEEGDEESPKKRGRGRTTNKDKETVKGFTDAEVRRFFRSMKRFSNPLRRIDTISRDADLRDKPVTDLRRLAELIIERCKQFMAELERQQQLHPEREPPPKKRGKQPGNSFKLSGVSINAKTTLTALEELAPLDAAVPHALVQRASWILPIKKVKDTHWDVHWTVQDDSRLLCGVYEYGFGQWEQIKMDPALSLGDKILLSNDQKPQAKQLENRVQYLLKLIKKHSIPAEVKAPKVRAGKARAGRPSSSRVKEPKGISREIIDDDSSDEEASNHTAASSAGGAPAHVAAPATKAPAHTLHLQEDKEKEYSKEVKEHKEANVKVKVKEEKPENEEKHPKEEKINSQKKKEKKERKRDKNKGPVHIGANTGPQPLLEGDVFTDAHPDWWEVKSKMKPMKKYLENLNDGGGKNVSEEQKIENTKKSVVIIGDYINTLLVTSYTEHTDIWKVLFWRFVARFTEFDAKRLHKFYKKTKRRAMEQQPENAEELSKDSDERKVKKEHHHHHHKDKKKHNEENSSTKAVKRKREEDNAQEKSPKKAYNGTNNTVDAALTTAASSVSAAAPQPVATTPVPFEAHAEAVGREHYSRWDDQQQRDKHREDYNRERSRDRDYRNRDRDDAYQRHQRHRDWHKRDNRYPPMGYHRDRDYAGGGYHRGGDWRSGRPPHQKPHPVYPPPPGSGYQHYPPLLPVPPPHMYGHTPPPTIHSGMPGYAPYNRGDWGASRNHKGSRGDNWYHKDHEGPPRREPQGIPADGVRNDPRSRPPDPRHLPPTDPRHASSTDPRTGGRNCSNIASVSPGYLPMPPNISGTL